MVGEVMKKQKKDGVRMLQYFKSVKASLVWFVIFTIIMCVISVVTPIVNANLLTSLTELNINKSMVLALIMILVSLLKVFNSYFANVVYLRKIKKNVMLNIRRDMIKNVFEMETANFDEHSSGEFTNRISSDPENISAILSVVQYSFFNLITDIFVVGYIFYLNWILGLIYVLSLYITYNYEKNTMDKLKQISEKNKIVSDKNSGLLNEVIRGIRDIKTLNLTKKMHEMVIDGLDESTKLEGDKAIKSSASYDITQFMQSITIFVIIVVGILLVNNNLLTATNLIIIYMYKTNVYDISLCYRSVKEYLNEYSIASKRIFEFMDNKKYPKEKFGKKELEKVDGKIEISNLSFAYDKKKVLNNINLIIEPNDTIGIVGESGNGKTTLLNLLSKSYNVSNHKIKIDGIDINDLTKESLRDNVSVISQNPYIFNLSITDNFKLVGDNITDEQIVDACKIAQIHDYIMTLPNKYDTLLGEGGLNLSGGQRQRLAIARALLKKSKIILFDEATSALDNVTQNELQKSINNISDDYTIIIVAHRLSTIKDCNKIYVMNNGEIVASGTHKELLKNEYYKKLYQQDIA